MHIGRVLPCQRNGGLRGGEGEMKIKSTALGSVILLILFGSIAASASIGWWQTEGGGRQSRGQGLKNEGEIAQNQTDANGAEEESHTIYTLHGSVNYYDLQGISVTTDDGQTLYIKLGNKRYNQSLGFAPQVGEGVIISGFVNEEGRFNAMTVTLDATARAYAFRDAEGSPLWNSGSGNEQ
jgi:hypothetical protein